LMVEK